MTGVEVYLVSLVVGAVAKSTPTPKMKSTKRARRPALQVQQHDPHDINQFRAQLNTRNCQTH